MPRDVQSERDPDYRPSARRGPSGVLYADLAADASIDARPTAESLSAALAAPLLVLGTGGSRGRVPWNHPRNQSKTSSGIRAWCERVLPRQLATRSRAVDLSAAVADAVRRRRPEIVVVPDLSGQSGRWVPDLALRVATPVLLVRHEFCSDSIVVASDLTSRGYPVLRMGAGLSRLLHKRVLFVHNLRLTLTVSSQSDPMCARFSTVTAGGKLNELAAVAQSLGVESENVVMAAATPAEAVIRVAERELADITVVGARSTSREGAGHVPFAQQIIDRSSRSVLVVPL